MPAPQLLGVALHTLASAARDHEDDGRPMPRTAAAFAARLEPSAISSRRPACMDSRETGRERKGPRGARCAHPAACPSDKLDRVAERLDRCRELSQALSEDMQTQAAASQIAQDRPSQREDVRRLRTASGGHGLSQTVVDVYVALLTMRNLLREKGQFNDRSDALLYIASL